MIGCASFRLVRGFALLGSFCEDELTPADYNVEVSRLTDAMPTKQRDGVDNYSICHPPRSGSIWRAPRIFSARKPEISS